MNLDIVASVLKKGGKKYSPISPLEKISMVRDLQTVTCEDKLKDMVLSRDKESGKTSEGGSKSIIRVLKYKKCTAKN